MPEPDEPIRHGPEEPQGHPSRPVLPGRAMVRFGAGLGGTEDSIAAGRSAAERARIALERAGGQGCDLAIAFFSSHHVATSLELAKSIRDTIKPRHLLGVSSHGVIAGATEVEGAPGVSVLAASMPNVAIRGFTADELLSTYDSPDGLDNLEAAIGTGDPLRGVLLFSDPTTVPMIRLLPTLGDAAGDDVPIIGGMASSGRNPGSNALFLDGRVVRAGLVGVSLSGAVKVDSIVSQGCRPFGPNFVVTKAKGNMVFELSGKPAIDAIREAVQVFGERAEKVLQGGLFFGRVINEYKERFGRDDFLIRPVVGVKPDLGGVAAADILRVGTTVRMHVRDADTAREDLAMLIDGQVMREPPRGAMLISCNGRGRKLFGEPHQDARAVARLFMSDTPGEELARAGREMGPMDPSPPIAGFFAAGEFGPVGKRSYLHGSTTSVALFREP